MWRWRNDNGSRADAPLSAGSWHLVGDGIIIAPVDVRYDVIRRRPAAMPIDQTIVTFHHHFDPPAAGFDAQQFEQDGDGIAADVQTGDVLVLRFTVQSANGGVAYIPNGDGDKAHGRIPSLSLPPAK